MIRPFRKQQGFAIVVAVVLVTVFALLGTFMLMSVTTQNMTTSLSQREMQAWFAAQSGLEWGIQQIQPPTSGCNTNGACSGATTCETTVNGSTLSPGSHAAGFTVTMSCSCSCVKEGSKKFAMYDLRGTATQGNVSGIDYISRSARAVVKGKDE